MKRFLLILMMIGFLFPAVTRYGTEKIGWIVDEIVSEEIITSGTLVRDFEVGQVTKFNFAVAVFGCLAFGVGLAVINIKQTLHPGAAFGCDDRIINRVDDYDGACRAVHR